MKRLLISSLFGCMLMSQAQMVEQKMKEVASLALGFGLSAFATELFLAPTANDLDSLKQRGLVTVNNSSKPWNLEPKYTLPGQNHSEQEQSLLNKGRVHPGLLLGGIFGGCVALLVALTQKDTIQRNINIGMSAGAFLTTYYVARKYSLELPTQNFQ